MPLFKIGDGVVSDSHIPNLCDQFDIRKVIYTHTWSLDELSLKLLTPTKNNETPQKAIGLEQGFSTQVNPPVEADFLYCILGVLA